MAVSIATYRKKARTNYHSKLSYYRILSVTSCKMKNGLDECYFISTLFIQAIRNMTVPHSTKFRFYPFFQRHGRYISPYRIRIYENLTQIWTHPCSRTSSLSIIIQLRNNAISSDSDSPFSLDTTVKGSLVWYSPCVRCAVYRV